jgi:hypothetical protein
MRLDYVLLANHAETLPDGLVNLLGGGVRVYDVPRLPHMVPVFYVVARASFAPEEQGKVFPFTVRIHDPQGELIPEAQIESECSPGQSQHPELPHTTTFLVAFQGLTFPTAGLYKLTFRLGDLDPIVLPVLVHQKPVV